MSLEHIIETDVLVLGGGMAGCFAAIKTKEQGLTVTLVDKSYAGKSGSSAWPHSFCVFNPEWGHNLNEWMDHINIGGEYLNNREWTELIFKESYERYQDLVSWGVEFHKEENGQLYQHKVGPLLTPYHTESLLMKQREIPQVLRKKAEESDVQIFDRIMITDLLKQDGKIVGAIGIAVEKSDVYIFRAKATVLATGCAGFKPAGWPIAQLTGDGQAMAYRAGAELTGSEFIDTHCTRTDLPAWGMHFVYWRGRKFGGRKTHFNAEGSELKLYPGGRSYTPNIEFEAHAGRIPLIQEYGEEKINIVGGAAGGLALHTTEGVWPINKKCATGIPGLFAAGDSLGTMQIGTVYSGVGYAATGACVTGFRAGLGAAEYALESEKPTIDEEEISRLKKIIYAPLKRKGGFSPRWITQILQNLTMPYYILFIKHEERMRAVLTLVEFMRDHLVPKLTANDSHELRLAHETKNMVLAAEMKLRSSLFRTESRGCHYREDYPRRDDPDWLAWVILKKKEDGMKFSKRPIPRDWWPDLSKSYEEIYPVRFPGE